MTDHPRFTTQRREVSTGEVGWGTDSGKPWSEAIVESNEVTVGEAVGASPTDGISDTDILMEEDGSLSEYTGDTPYYSTTTSPTATGSSHAISYSNNSSEQSIETTFPENEYPHYSMYVYPANSRQNCTVLLIDSSTGNVVFGIYHSNLGIYYSNKGVRNDGVLLTNDYGSYHRIDFVNIDWANETVEILLDGNTVTTESFINSGVPDTLKLTTNSGTAITSSGGWVDEVYALSQ